MKDEHSFFEFEVELTLKEAEMFLKLFFFKNENQKRK